MRIPGFTTLGNSLPFLGPQSAHLNNGHVKSYLSELSRESVQMPTVLGV